MKLGPALLACALLGGGVGYAHTMGDVDQVCPLDGTKFVATLDMSGTTTGMDLDMRPTGYTAAPWRVAVCPKDHFPLFKEKLKPAEVTDLRAFVRTPEYVAWAKRESDYYLIAQIMLHQKEKPLLVGHILLEASWEVMGQPDTYLRYATEALAQLKLGLASVQKADEASDTAQLVAVELERRTKQFDAAAARIVALQANPRFKTEIFSKILARQTALVAAKDFASHPIEERKR
jgi:hypothetical protein